MSNVINASFEVISWDEQPFDECPDASKVTSANVAKSYRGGIEGDSVTEWLMAYADDGTATFVGMERIIGQIEGRSGTLVLRHVGRYRDGSATAELYVAPGSSSGELAGITGHGQFSADPAGRVRLELTMA